jgi:hypothetical protein
MEESEAGTIVGELQATDIDMGTFGEIEYTIDGPYEIIRL